MKKILGLAGEISVEKEQQLSIFVKSMVEVRIVFPQCFAMLQNECIWKRIGKIYKKFLQFFARIFLVIFFLQLLRKMWKMTNMKSLLLMECDD